MWRSQLLKFFKLFKLTTKHTKHGPSRTLEISGSFQMHDFAAFSILNSLLSRFVAKPIFATRCGLFDPIPLFFNVFFLKADGAQLWHALPQSLPMHCTLYLLKNGKSSWHLTPCYSFEFSALQCWLFVQLQFRRTDATAQQP